MSRLWSSLQRFVETAQRPLQSSVPSASTVRSSTEFQSGAAPFRSPSVLLQIGLLLHGQPHELIALGWKLITYPGLTVAIECGGRVASLHCRAMAWHCSSWGVQGVAGTDRHVVERSAVRAATALHDRAVVRRARGLESGRSGSAHGFPAGEPALGSGTLCWSSSRHPAQG